MGYHRKLRRKDELHITGPCVIRIKTGRPHIEIDADRATKISHVKGKRDRRLTSAAKAG